MFVNHADSSEDFRLKPAIIRLSLLPRLFRAMPAKLSINDVDVSGKRVFMRVDFNVPQDKADPTKSLGLDICDVVLGGKLMPWQMIPVELQFQQMTTILMAVLIGCYLDNYG